MDNNGKLIFSMKYIFSANLLILDIYNDMCILGLYFQALHQSLRMHEYGSAIFLDLR